MANGNSFKPNRTGQRALRNSPGVQQMLLAEAGKVKRAAEGYSSGLAYTTDVNAGKERAHAWVTTANPKAFYTQMKHKNLSSAIG